MFAHRSKSCRNCRKVPKPTKLAGYECPREICFGIHSSVHESLAQTPHVSEAQMDAQLKWDQWTLGTTGVVSTEGHNTGSRWRGPPSGLFCPRPVCVFCYRSCRNGIACFRGAILPGGITFKLHFLGCSRDRDHGRCHEYSSWRGMRQRQDSGQTPEKTRRRQFFRCRVRS